MKKIKKILHPHGKFIHAGWDQACSTFKSHDTGIVNLDTFFEASFGWMHVPSIIPEKSKNYPNQDFIAFIHNPFYSYKFNHLLSNPIVQPYPEPILKLINQHCRGLFFMSSHERDIFDSYFQSNGINVPCETLYHPLQNLPVHFSWNKFTNNKNKLLIQAGMHLRKPSSISVLAELIRGSDLTASIVPWNKKNETNLNIELKQCSKSVNLDHLSKIPELNSVDYIKLYENNIFFLDLHDVSACNVVLDCIATNTPIIIKRLPANEEYLGKNYPLFFDSLPQAAEFAIDYELLLEAHLYLKNFNKSIYGISQFKCNFLQSQIYQSL